MINIKMFKANEGDAFLVSLGKNKDFNIMIDMGLDSTYRDYIKTFLLDIKKDKKKIDLLVITHIDEDHILGALEFIKENGKERDIVDVGEVWLNTYRHLQFEKEKVKNISAKDREKVENIIDSNAPTSYKEDGNTDISIGQGMSLGAYLLKYKYNWNSKFDEDAVVCVQKTRKICLNKDVKIILLSPNEDKLAELSKRWLKDLRIKYNLKEISNEEFWDDAFEYYMQYLKDDECEVSDISSSVISKKNIEKWKLVKGKDRSETNGSSIAFIIEYKEKKLLFLGDAHEDIIYESLLELKNKGYKLDFDVIKISHHGSNKNISKRLVELIEGRKYLISTDGNKHNHPNMECISKILAKTTEHKKELYFNYEIDKIMGLNNDELQNDYGYIYKIAEEEKYITIEIEEDDEDFLEEIGEENGSC